MSPTPHLLLLAAVAVLAACAAPAKRPAPAVSQTKVRVITAEERAFIDRSFYRAVLAYREGSWSTARDHLAAILKLDPAHPDAIGLRRRVLAAEKIAAQ